MKKSVLVGIILVAVIGCIMGLMWYIATKNYMTGGINVPLIIALSLTLTIPITLFIIIVTHKFRSKYYKKMFIALTIAYTVILVSMFTVLYYSPGVRYGPYGTTPYCSLNTSTSGTESGKTQVNVTWMVSSPSRADIKWSDILQSSAKVLCNGTVLAQTTNYTWQAWPTGTYVTSGDTITVTLNRTAVAPGSIIKLILIYAPAGCTLSESSVTLNYTV